MNTALTLEGENIILEAFTLEHAEQLVAWRNDENIIRYFLNPKPLKMKDHLNWFNNSYLSDGDRIDFVITDKKGGEAAGTAGIKNIASKNVELSYAIGNFNMRGKGFAKEAVNMLMSYAKNEFGANKATALIHEENAPSRGFILNLGFNYTGERYGENPKFMVFSKDL